MFFVYLVKHYLTFDYQWVTDNINNQLLIEFTIEIDFMQVILHTVFVACMRGLLWIGTRIL